MCGIFALAVHGGRTTLKAAVEEVLSGLEALEYRGYDSAGLAVDYPDEADQTVLPHVVKSVGSVGSLASKTYGLLPAHVLQDTYAFEGSLIAHTRWATHGEATIENAHPHSSNETHDFLAVHNGIITNYLDLRHWLQLKGYNFASTTDSEVIPKLAHYFHAMHPSAAFPEIIRLVVERLDGQYSFVIKSARFAGELVAFRYGTPLCIAHVDVQDGDHSESFVKNIDFERAGKSSFAEQTGLRTRHEYMSELSSTKFIVSSDSGMVSRYSDRVHRLANDTIVHVVGAKYTAYAIDREANSVRSFMPALEKIASESMMPSKGTFGWFMEKEIFEQPHALSNTIAGNMSRSFTWNDLSTILPASIAISQVRLWKSCNRIVLTGCGTSFHACLAAHYTFQKLCTIQTIATLACEAVDYGMNFRPGDLVICVSQSGETSDTMDVLRRASSQGALTLAVVNAPHSMMADEANFTLYLCCGKEIGVASTKAYTSQILLLNLIALYCCNHTNEISNAVHTLMADILRLPGVIESTLHRCKDSIASLSHRLAKYPSILMFGRGINFASCLEGALKVKEISHIHCEGLHAGEMKHGPLALVDDNLPLVVICPYDSWFSSTKSAVAQLRARKGQVILITTAGSEQEFAGLLDSNCFQISVESICDFLQPIVIGVVLQLLAFNLTVCRGLDVDKPRNLAKSVTVS